MSVQDEFNRLAELKNINNINTQSFISKKKIVDVCIQKTQELWLEMSKIKISQPSNSDNLLLLDISSSLSVVLEKSKKDLLDVKEKLNRLSNAYSAVINNNFPELVRLTQKERNQKDLQNIAMGFLGDMFSQFGDIKFPK